MIIRCPQCEHTRSISESNIPPSAELATCPKCKHRFRFRPLSPAVEPEAPAEPASPARAASDPAPRSPGFQAQETQRPQSAFRESAARDDIWDAVDALHQRWEKQMDKNVTEVETPRPEPAPQAAAQAVPQASPQPTVQAAAQAGSSDGPERIRVAAFAGDEAIPDAPDESGKAAEEERGAFIFPYSDGGPDPEERVEQDLRMLRDAPEERPLRDLGMLREFSDVPSGADGEEAGPDTDRERGPGLPENAIPWENPAGNGWLRGFMATVHGVMFRGPDFFSGFGGSGSLAPGYLFFLLMGYLTIIGALVWTQATAILLPNPGALPAGGVGLPTLLLLAPLALGLMLLFVTGWIRIVLRLFSPEQAEFTVIYRIVAYAAAPFILSIVPFVGPPVGALWFLASLTTGCRNALGLSWPLAILAPLPPAGVLLFGMVRYFL